MQNKIPLIDVSRQNQAFKAEIMEALSRVYDSGAFILGPEVTALEQEFRTHTGVHTAVSCASGTDALVIPLMAMDLKPGDEVLVPSFTFYASVASIVRAGGTPVFVDSDETYNICLKDLERKLSSRTRAVIPVYLFGQMVKIPEFQAVLKKAKQKIFVLEDVAQSMGASYKGKQAGAWGDYGAFSFYPTKNLGAMGDAGMMSACSPELAERIQMIRVHGSKQRYFHECIGFNSRLDSMQAAILRVKLKNLRRFEEERARVASEYQRLFHESGLTKKVRLPVVHGGEYRSVWNQFTIRVPKRDELRKFLSEEGIGTEVYYPLPMHLQKCFTEFGLKKGDLPNCESMMNEVLSLPMYPELKNADIARVVETIQRFNF